VVEGRFGARAAAVAFAAVVALGLASLVASPPAIAYPNPGLVTGYTVVHDPSMIIKQVAGAPCECGDPRYIVYGTGNSTLTSNDRVAFANSGPFFPLHPAWWTAYRSDGNVWAPDVSFHNGQYWLYYAISADVGSRRSAIGLATSPSGLPGTWTDQGPIFSSSTTDDYNAIDPNLLVDAQGKWWLTFGSYWGGIFMMSLDPQTGRPVSSTPALFHLAERPRSKPGPGDAGPGIEGAFVFRQGGYYYLFASFDKCCDGVNSTYNIRVGRSTSPTGPYTDAANVDMLAGGGKLILGSHDYAIGPGGQSVYHDDYFGSHDLLVYHYYDARAAGLPMLGINFLDFSSGFPVVY
jgi:arabinan endo-1,5-alpha-L-arabinosidase